ncbi:MAG: CopG family ribbon-helix-helix protein [Gammaproteobacteria bacterium]
MASSTSSFRIPQRLKAQLERAARRLNKKKNWIINRALEEFLQRHSRADLRAEARRQSVMASRTHWQDQLPWEKAGGEAWND